MKAFNRSRIRFIVASLSLLFMKGSPINSADQGVHVLGHTQRHRRKIPSAKKLWRGTHPSFSERRPGIRRVVPK